TASSGRPIIMKPKGRFWHPANIPYMAHGYSELVTPLHMLMIYNAVANNGKMMRPYLVSAIQDYGSVVRTIEPQVLEEKICSDETVAQLKECMRAVVDSLHGTAHKVIYDTAYAIAGKNGTAVTALNNKGYNKGNKIYQASFIGYFPADAPKYTMAVVIQNSNESKLIYGADVSGRVFKEISDRIYNHYICKSSLNNKAAVDSSLYQYWGMKEELTTLMRMLKLPYRDSAVNGVWRKLLLKNQSVGMARSEKAESGKSLTPDVTGMGLKDAVYVLENKGLKTIVNGRGKVISQSLMAGMPYRKGEKIILTLN
ncbi:MAG TPA: penicillin-binding transpeptidase domain-containing protein, partial [Ferruginibacter sp.]|nr:penicillin-binding transpeptidase domain-containing protein [Ferruginibacter sp.]